MSSVRETCCHRSVSTQKSTDSPASVDTPTQPPVRTPTSLHCLKTLLRLSWKVINRTYKATLSNIYRDLPDNTAQAQLTAVINKMNVDYRNVSAWSHLLQSGQYDTAGTIQSRSHAQLSDILKMRSVDYLLESPPLRPAQYHFRPH